MFRVISNSKFPFRYFMPSIISQLHNCNLATFVQIICIEQENESTEGATQQEDVVGSYQLMQQLLRQANDTIATLMEQLSRVEPTSQLIIGL